MQTERNWQCSLCDAVNSASARVCSVCRSLRCPACTFVNSPNHAGDRCGVCEAPLSSPSATATTAPVASFPRPAPTQQPLGQQGPPLPTQPNYTPPAHSTSPSSSSSRNQQPQWNSGGNSSGGTSGGGRGGEEGVMCSACTFENLAPGRTHCEMCSNPLPTTTYQVPESVRSNIPQPLPPVVAVPVVAPQPQPAVRPSPHSLYPAQLKPLIKPTTTTPPRQPVVAGPVSQPSPPAPQPSTSFSHSMQPQQRSHLESLPMDTYVAAFTAGLKMATETKNNCVEASGVRSNPKAPLLVFVDSEGIRLQQVEAEYLSSGRSAEAVIPMVHALGPGAVLTPHRDGAGFDIGEFGRQLFGIIGSSGNEASVSRWKLFGEHGPLPSDIRQGELGDCWFLSAVSVIAYRFPEKITELFVFPSAAEFQDQKDRQGSAESGQLSRSVPVDATGVFVLRLWKDGCWTPVMIDSQFPVIHRNMFRYGRCGDGVSLWVSLLEKGYAKLMGGSYMRLCGGNSM